MKDYVKASTVLAEQFSPTDAEKQSIVKKDGKPYEPKSVMDCELKERNGQYFIAKNVGAEVVVLNENDWLIKEGDKYSVVTDEEFQKSYKPLATVKVSKSKDKTE